MNTTTAKRRIKLGNTGPEVSPLGLGCMGMSGMYGEADEAESVRTIHAAIERGIDLLDTGDFYGMGHNEMLIGRAIAGRRNRVKLSVKFGALRAPDGSWVGMDLRPNAMKNFVAYSLKRLGTDVIDIYRPARIDPNIPIEETIGAMTDLVKAGWIRHISLSEVGAETIRRAQAVAPIVDVQIEYSVASRGPEREVFPTLRELGISATLYGVFSRGLLTGSKPRGKDDFRSHLPRFNGDSAKHNAGVVAAFARFATDRKMTPGQLALAWVRTKEPTLLPVVGARTVSQLEDSLAALDKPLAAADVTALEAIMTVSGDRYGAEHLRMLDSEK